MVVYIMYPPEMLPLSQAPIAIIYNLSNMSGVGTDAKVEVAVTYSLTQNRSRNNCKVVVNAKLL